MVTVQKTLAISRSTISTDPSRGGMIEDLVRKIASKIHSGLKGEAGVKCEIW